jgi:hypothetical protein
MSKVISFPQSPLTPFLGSWAIDPLSVSRNKVVKRRLGEDGLKKLWSCPSLQERALCLASDPDLAQKYQELLKTGIQRYLVVTPQTITWNRMQSTHFPENTTVCPVLRVASEGRKAIVHTVDMRSGAQRVPVAYVFRMSGQWLLVSERYEGRRAQIFPRSPVHRYSPMQ